MSGETFEDLLAPNLQAVRNFVSAKLRMSDHTDDVLQQTLLHAFAHRDQLRVHSKFKSWLWSIAMNEVRGFHRRARPSFPLDVLPDFASSDRLACPHARYELQESAERVNEALSKLADRDRDTIHLVDLGERKVSEAAKAMSVTTSALKSSHYRARQRLGRMLREARQGRRHVDAKSSC
ncbi:MAG: sigma-70 family RNA polymerase sigma factor [Ignavibacteriota bacterium]